MTPNEFYTSTLAECGTALKRLGRRSLTVAMLRLAVFAATVAAIVMLWHSTAAVAACFVAGLIVFLYLAKFSNRLAAAKQIEEAKILWAKNHIDRLQLKLDKLPKGEQHADANHDYTFDIDVFGSKSLFSLLDSTATPYGSEQLAAWLKNPKETAADTVQRQEAVRELAAKNAFRLKMASAGTVATNEMAECKKVSDEVPDFSVNGIQKAAIAVIPYIYVILFTLMAFDIVPGLLIFNVFLLTLILGSLQAKRVGRLHEWITRKVATVTCCADIFKTIEEEEFSSAVLQQLQRNMGSDRGNASELSRRLARYINNLDQRYNVFGYAIMNGFLLWDWRQLNNIDRWMKANGKHLDDWKNAIAEYDAFCALASFAFNNPGYTFPTLDTTGKVIMEAKQAGHPLIPSDRCVCNDNHRHGSQHGRKKHLSAYRSRQLPAGARRRTGFCCGNDLLSRNSLHRSAHVRLAERRCLLFLCRAVAPAKDGETGGSGRTDVCDSRRNPAWHEFSRQAERLARTGQQARSALRHRHYCHPRPCARQPGGLLPRQSEQLPVRSRNRRQPPHILLPSPPRHRPKHQRLFPHANHGNHLIRDNSILFFKTFYSKLLAI